MKPNSLGLMLLSSLYCKHRQSNQSRQILTYIVIKSTFNQLFLSKFEAGFLLVVTKSIKSATNIIEKFKLDRKRLKRDQREIEKVNLCQLFRLNLTFSIKIDFLDF